MPAAVIGAAALFSLAPASALAALPSSLQATGLTEPAGTIVDPLGKTWLSDGAGFCRLTDGTAAAPAQLDGPTCLGGGVLLAPPPGPGAPGQPAFQDPTPSAPNSGDEVAYVPDGAAASHDLDVLQWNPASGTFSLKKTIALANVRPTSASVGPDGNVYVAFKASPTGDIERVSAPLSDAPSVAVVGHTDGASSVAAGYDAGGALTLYTAEATIMQLHPNTATQPTSTAAPFDLGQIGSPPAPRELGAVYYDLHDHVLYAGTADAAHIGAGLDVVDRFSTDSGTAELDYATGFTAVVSIGVDSAGNLLVGDGPKADQMTLARDNAAPATPVITAPTDRTTVDGAPTFAFSSTTDGGPAWSCSLDGGAYQPCAPGQPFAFVSNGAHTLQVKATDRAGNVSAASAPIAFTVRLAPVAPVAPLAPVTPAAPDVRPVSAPAPTAPARPRPGRRLFYRVASRRAMRVGVVLNPPATPVLRLRLYRLRGTHEHLVGSVLVRTADAPYVRATLIADGPLRDGRYRLEARAGRTATTLKPLSTLALTVRR